MGDSFQAALQSIRESAFTKLAQTGAEEELNQLRIELLGRKGKLTHLLRSVRELPPEERREAGERANTVKQELEARIDEFLVRLRDEAKRRALAREELDITLPGTPLERGRLHPITQVMARVVAIFTRMGFQVAEGPQVELDYYNFEALNIPRDHPARDMHDTFYFSDEVLLRTHTRSSRRVRSIDGTLTYRTPPCFIRSRGSWWMRGSPLPTSRGS